MIKFINSKGFTNDQNLQQNIQEKINSRYLIQHQREFIFYNVDYLKCKHFQLFNRKKKSLSKTKSNI